MMPKLLSVSLDLEVYATKFRKAQIKSYLPACLIKLLKYFFVSDILPSFYSTVSLV